MPHTSPPSSTEEVDNSFLNDTFGSCLESLSLIMKDEETLQSTEEMFDPGSFSEKGSDDSDCKSEYCSINGINGSDTEDERVPLPQRKDSKISHEASQRCSNQDCFFQNPENEVGFGNSDWAEYLHEYEVEVIGSADPAQVYENGVDQDTNVELTERLPDGDYLPLDGTNVKGTGRPDLDDVEDDLGIAEESFSTEPHGGVLADRFQSSESGIPYLDDECMFPVVGIVEEARVPSVQDVCRVIPETDTVSTREDLDYCILELPNQDNVGSPVELNFKFANSSSDQIDDGDTSRSGRLHEGRDSIGSALLDVNFNKKFNEPLGHCATEAVLEKNSPTECVGGREAGLGTADVANSLHVNSFQESRDVMQDTSHEVPQEAYLQAGTDSEIAEDGLRKRSRIMRLGSKEAEELLQMDVTKFPRAVYTPLEAVQDYKRVGVDWATEDLGPDELSRYVEALEVKETYIDTVLDMEDILFDAEEGSGARTIQIGKKPSLGIARRDGSLSASTSSNFALVSRLPWQSGRPTELEWVEVVGASQQQGGASLGERVVGVKQHTVYRIKVRGGGNEWEIHRRYRDFVTLYNQLQRLFDRKDGVHLPSPWEKVKAESRKFFGNTSPGVVEIRSALVQVCLQSLLQAGPPLSRAAPLLRFLFPSGDDFHSRVLGGPASGKHTGEGQSESQVLLEDFVDYSPRSDMSGNADQDQDGGGHDSVFGKTIRLVVQVHKKKPLKQQLQAQHYTCAGCYKRLELALGIVPELVQNWGWGGPRLCEYSGQLFCSTCHLSETAVIPAWVLQRWDFAPRPVSQLAKAYLDSIYDKPMLCVSAVNPYLYARVPVLAHLTEIRRKLSKMLACIRCPARARIQSMLGSRRYLLENNDFFALRDLADLSKGAFAVLPGYMRALLLKLSIHISRECSTCRELGEACGAGDFCDDPLDVIYPYQDENIARCQFCHIPYHKRCFDKFQKRCVCRTGPATEMLKDSSESSDVFYNEHDVDPAPRNYLSSSIALETEDSPSSSSTGVGENKPKPKKSLLSNFLGSKEAQGPESQKEKWNSLVLSTSALSSPLEL